MPQGKPVEGVAALPPGGKGAIHEGDEAGAVGGLEEVGELMHDDMLYPDAEPGRSRLDEGARHGPLLCAANAC